MGGNFVYSGSQMTVYQRRTLVSRLAHHVTAPRLPNVITKSHLVPITFVLLRDAILC